MRELKNELAFRTVSNLHTLLNPSYRIDVLPCLSNILEYSKELFEHSMNTAFYSTLIGTYLYNDKNTICELCIASLLHDYGKIYIPKYIYEKQSSFNKEERITMEFHPVVGHFHLKQQTKLNDKILAGILDHHEKLDGSGYGRRKASEDISEYAKIISVADTYDAMISDRIYRKAIPKKDVITYLQNRSGIAYDTEITSLFISITKDPQLEQLKAIFRKEMMQFIGVKHKATINM